MRKIIAAVFIFISVITYSQWSNTFSKENEEVLTSNPKEGEPEPGLATVADTGELPAAEGDCDNDGIPDTEDDEMDCGTPNPGDPVPADDYIPLLFIIAAGLITYKTYGRKSLS